MSGDMDQGGKRDAMKDELVVGVKIWSAGGGGRREKNKNKNTRTRRRNKAQWQ